jgi:hypothetical protein
MKVQMAENAAGRIGSKVEKNEIAAPRVLLVETSRLPYIALFAMDLTAAGAVVSSICPARHPMLMTQAVRKTFPYRGLRPVESLLKAIEATNPHIIIPCDDRAVRHLHELYARQRKRGVHGSGIADLIEKSLGAPQSFPIVSGRYNLIKVAGEEGLAVPDTEPINSESDLVSWHQKHPFPWVLKADGTYGGDGVRIVHNLEQARRFLGELTRFYTPERAIKRFFVNRDAFWLRPWWNGVKPAISVQSYIRGCPANCAAVCWEGKVLAFIGVQVICAAGETGSASVVRVMDDPGDMLICAERIARRLNLSGFFGLDFIIEEGTESAYLIEMNPRPTRISRLQLGKGCDLIGALSAQLLNQPIRDLPPVTQNKMIAYFPDAVELKKEILDASFHDVPSGCPDLIRELHRPWPTRTFLWRMADQIDLLKRSLLRRVSRPEPAANGEWAFQRRSKP